MASSIKYRVKCSCGHEGAINMRENDQPFSKQWERYSLIDLKGNEAFEVSDYIDWATVFKRLNPLCPKCNCTLKPENILSE